VINKLCGRPPQYSPARCKLTFDLLTLKVVYESRVTWATSVSILVFLGLSVPDLGPMYTTVYVKQTSDVHHHLMPPGTGRYSDNRYSDSCYSDKCFRKGANNTNSNPNPIPNPNSNPNPKPLHYPFRNIGIVVVGIAAVGIAAASQCLHPMGRGHNNSLAFRTSSMSQQLSASVTMFSYMLCKSNMRV